MSAMKAITAIVLAAASLSGMPPDSYGQNAPWRSNIAVCASCHGAHGEGSSTAGAPRLAGQNVEYMAHALSMFKAGTRASPVMQPIARGLSDPDARALAEYFAAQSVPPVVGTPVSPRLVELGKQLAATGSTPCFGCHGAAGQGNGARYPSIAGQPAQFVVDRLHEFQQRARAKTPQPGTMTAVSTTMTEEQIEAYAAYLSRLPPRRTDE